MVHTKESQQYFFDKYVFYVLARSDEGCPSSCCARHAAQGPQGDRKGQRPYKQDGERPRSGRIFVGALTLAVALWTHLSSMQKSDAHPQMSY